MRRVPVTSAPRKVRRSAAAVVAALEVPVIRRVHARDHAPDRPLGDAPVVLHLDHLGHGLTQWQT